MKCTFGNSRLINNISKTALPIVNKNNITITIRIKSSDSEYIKTYNPDSIDPNQICTQLDQPTSTPLVYDQIFQYIVKLTIKIQLYQ